MRRFVILSASYGVVAAWFVGLLTLSGFLGRLWFVFDLACHFRPHYLVASLLLAAIFLRLRRFVPVLCLLFVAVANFAVLFPYIAPSNSRPASGPSERIFFANVNRYNRDFASALALAQQPNLLAVVITEVDDEWAKALEVLKASYPYSIVKPRSDKFGMVLYSKLPFAEEKIYEFPGIAAPSVAFDVTLMIGGEPIRIVASHSLAPLSQRAFTLRNQMLQSLGDVVGGKPTPIVFVADLNATPWSPAFQRFLRQTELVDAREGRGLFPTWPAALGPAALPIDHCLVGRGVAAVDLVPTEKFGSDHLGIVCEFRLPRAPSSSN